MSRLRIAPIVEGHGEVHAIRLLLDRVWRELLGGEYAETLKPVRCPRSKLLKHTPQGASVPDPHELGRAVGLAAAKLSAVDTGALPALILVLVDADSDCPATLVPGIRQMAAEHARGLDVACVMAKLEYETWFVAAAESLGDHLSLGEDDVVPEDPEQTGARKAWIEKRFKGGKYSETVDQPKMTAKMDLQLCRRRSPSFDKLCRELEQRIETRRS